MPSSADAASRRRVLTVCATQGAIGLALMLWVTLLRHDLAHIVMDRLRPNGLIVIAICTAFALTLALLKFELTDQIYV